MDSLQGSSPRSAAPLRHTPRIQELSARDENAASPTAPEDCKPPKPLARDGGDVEDGIRLGQCGTSRYGRQTRLGRGERLAPANVAFDDESRRWAKTVFNSKSTNAVNKILLYSFSQQV